MIDLFRKSGRGWKAVVLGVTAVVSLSSCGGCGNDAAAPSDEAVIGQKGGDKTLSGVTVTVPEGAVAKDTKLTVTPPRKLEAAQSPLQGDDNAPRSIQFDVSLDDGAVQPAAGKPLTLKIPMTGDFVPEGADPRGAVVYTTTESGNFTLLDSELVGDALVVTTPHLSPKTVTYLTTDDIQRMLASGALTEVKDDCPKQGAAPPLQELKITQDAPNDLVEACLTTTKTDTFLAVRNRTPIMWGVKGSSGTEVLNTPDAFDDQAIKLLRGDLYESGIPQGVLARSSYINIKLNQADLPATVEVRAHQRLVNAELAWKAVQLFLQIKSGKKTSKFAKELEVALVKAPGLHECVQKTADLGYGDVIGYVFSQCGDALGKVTLMVFGDEAKGLLVPERWWGRIQAVGGGIKDGWHVVESEAMTVFNKFDAQKIDIVVGLANPCISAEEFAGIGASSLDSLGVTTLDPERIESRQGIQCQDGWALIEEMAVFVDGYAGYAILWGPILLKWSGNYWDAMGIYASPFDSGIDGGPVHETKAGCSAAPENFRNAVHC